MIFYICVPLQIAFLLNIKFLQFVGVWIHSLIFNCRVEIHYITTLKFIVLFAFHFPSALFSEFSLFSFILFICYI